MFLWLDLVAQYLMHYRDNVVENAIFIYSEPRLLGIYHTIVSLILTCGWLAGRRRRDRVSALVQCTMVSESHPTIAREPSEAILNGNRYR
jgi:hypothetical protein